MQYSQHCKGATSFVVQSEPVKTARYSYRLHRPALSPPVKRRFSTVCQFRPKQPSRHWEQPEQALRRRTSRPQRAPLPSWEEQGLCIGATFMVAATNGHDPSRRINLVGFCRSVEMLSEVVEDSVLRRGGEVVRRTCAVKSSLHESLHLTVAIPFLFGVPPAHEMLSEAIVLGGGIVDRVQRQWLMY